MPEVFEIFITTDFSAAHCLDGYQGDCAHTHGHNWDVEVVVRCETLDGLGMGLDFKSVKKSVHSVLEGLDHKDLNALDMFKDTNPTAENIAKYLYHQIAEVLKVKGVCVDRVKVNETPGTGVIYRVEK